MKTKNQIEAEDKMLKDLFRHSAMEPSLDLKADIMKQIQVRKEMFEYKSVISKKTWVMISGAFLSLFVFLSSQTGSSELPSFFQWKKLDFSGANRWLDQFDRYLNSVEFHLPEIPFPIMATMGVFIIAGVYFMISYSRWFRHSEQ